MGHQLAAVHPTTGTEFDHVVTAEADARPIIGNTINLNANNLQSTAQFGAFTIGLNALNPPIDLGPLGMPGCTQYTDQLANLLFFPAGAATGTVPFAVPNTPIAVGVNLQTQPFVYDPPTAQNAIGAIAGNAIELGIGDW